MIEIHITCAMCSKPVAVMNMDSISELNADGIEKRFEDSESTAVVQRNGDNLDIYCCKKCAA